jgi:glycine cleavage system protein P-like pyridoxal-binding family
VATFVVHGLGGPKVRPIGVADGLRVNIPVLGVFRYQLGQNALCYPRRLIDLASKL